MAKTTRDMILKARIESLMKDLKDVPEKEMVYAIAGQCGISHRCAAEHYKAIKYQRKFGVKETCTHQWSTWFTVPSGLAKECLMCHKTVFK